MYQMTGRMFEIIGLFNLDLCYRSYDLGHHQYHHDQHYHQHHLEPILNDPFVFADHMG
ncbi:unnamed protein product, partial [Musa hybrid cultivar]